MEPAYLTEANARLATAERALAEAGAFIAAHRAKLGSLVLSDPVRHGTLSAEIVNAQRRADTLAAETIPALTGEVKRAKARAEREAADRRRAGLEADASQIEGVLVPRIAKKIASLAADLDALKAHVSAVAAFNRDEARDFGLRPVVDGERRVRTIPGRTEPGLETYREEWQLGGRPYVGVFVKGASGELRPVHPAVKVRVPEIVPAREIEPRFARSYIDTVQLPGFMPGAPAHWPKVVG